MEKDCKIPERLRREKVMDPLSHKSDTNKQRKRRFLWRGGLYARDLLTIAAPKRDPSC